MAAYGSGITEDWLTTGVCFDTVKAAIYVAALIMMFSMPPLGRRSRSGTSPGDPATASRTRAGNTTSSPCTLWAWARHDLLQRDKNHNKNLWSSDFFKNFFHFLSFSMLSSLLLHIPEHVMSRIISDKPYLKVDWNVKKNLSFKTSRQ